MRRSFICAAVVALLCVPVLAQATREKALSDGQAALDKAVAFLQSQQQADGSWQRNEHEPPAITALALKVICRDPKSGKQAASVKKAASWLASIQQPDGGLYRNMLANYNTAICISALAPLEDPALKEPINKAVAYLKSTQWSDAIAAPGGNAELGKAFSGGWGYGGTQGRPDLSNTGVVLDALKEAGLKSDDAAYQNAAKFAARLQNFSESNPAGWAGNDGGFIYSPGRNGEGESSAGQYATPEGKRMLRSYGSMTYAGLKSMIYAGLSKDDPRVKAAWSWVRSNWTLEANPGMELLGPENARAGIYYYYYTLGRALAVYGEPTIQDKKGASHDWRLELIAAISSAQKPDGTFQGDRKWMEDNPVVATSLAMLALEDAMEDLQAHPVKLQEKLQP